MLMMTPPLAVIGVLAGLPLGPVSWTKLTLAPCTKPFPVMVTVCGCPVLALVPLMVAEVGEIELTEGTVGFHCQLFWVRLCPQNPVRLHCTGLADGAPSPGA